MALVFEAGPPVAVVSAHARIGSGNEGSERPRSGRNLDEIGACLFPNTYLRVGVGAAASFGTSAGARSMKPLNLERWRWASDTGMLAGARAVQVAIQLALVLALTRWWTKSDYGRYTFVLSVAEMLSLSCLPGMSTALTQAAARGFEGSLGDLTRYRLKWSVVGSLALAVSGAVYLGIRADRSVGLGLIAAAPVFGLYFVSQSYQSYFVALRRFRSVVAYNAASTASQSAVVASLVWFGAPVPWVVLGNMVPTALVGMGAIWHASVDGNGRVDRDARRFGWTLTGAAALGTVQARLQNVLIGPIAGYADLAAFRVAQQLTGEMGTLWGLISQQLFPRFAAMDRSQAYGTALQGLKYVVGGWAGLALGAALILKYVIPVLFGKNYVDSAFYGSLMLVTSVIGIAGSYLETYMLARKITRAYMLLRFIPIVNLVTLAPLVWAYGAGGALYSGIVGAVAYSVAAWVLVRRDHRMELATVAAV